MLAAVGNKIHKPVTIGVAGIAFDHRDTRSHFYFHTVYPHLFCAILENSADTPDRLVAHEQEYRILQ